MKKITCIEISITVKIFLLVVLFSLVGCVGNNKIEVSLKGKKVESLSISVSNIQVVNHQIIITGTNLNTVSAFNIKEGASTTALQIESSSGTSIIANSIANVTFAAGKVFDFVLSSASAASTFTVDFSLCDSKLGGKAFDCLITPTDKQVLSYDAASGKWKPRDVNGLNYVGAWDASGSTTPPAKPSGSYYIVGIAGDISGLVVSVGDWIVSNGTAWQKIDNSTVITSVFGRTGVVTALKGDYSLDQMSNVDLTGAASGNVLKFNGTNWVAGSVSAGGSVTSVSVTAPLAVSNGSTTPSLSMAQASTAANGYLTSTDWNTFNNKQATITAGVGGVLDYYRGDKTFQTLNTTVVPEGTHLYFTNARVLGLAITGFDNTLVGQIADTDNIVQAFGKTQKQINALTAGVSGYVATAGGSVMAGTTTLAGLLDATSSGDIHVGAPAGATSAISKGYADAADLLKLTKAGDTMSGLLVLDADLKIKGTTNYVTIKANAGTTTYNFSLPVDGGSNGQVLATNGSGGTSWIPVASAPVSTVFGRTGAVVAASSDYSATQVSNTPAGSIAAVNVQVAIAELDAEKQTTTLTSGNILVGNGSNVATSVAMSGDATLSNSGVLSIKAASTGDYFKYDGASWLGSPITIGDIKSLSVGNLFPGSACAANQTLSYALLVDAFTCVNIDSLDAAKITTGTIDVARLPASASFWSSATGGINFAGGNVGIGSSTPAGTLDVQGGTSTTGLGTNINLVAQSSLATSNNVGGAINLTGGNASWVSGAAKVGGGITLVGGTGAGTSFTSRGGPINIKGGPGASAAGQGGSVSISGGIGGSTAGPGGAASLTGGPALDGNGGSVSIGGGYGSSTTATARTGGSVNLTPGLGVNGGNNGNISLMTQDLTPTSPGGSNIILMVNNSVPALTAGQIYIRSGNVNVMDANGSGANLRLESGPKQGTGVHGNIILAAEGGNTGIGIATPTTKLQVAGEISPSVDNTYDLGDSSLRFTNVYAVNGTIQTSDARLKKEIKNTDLGLDFINKLRPVSYYWNSGPDKEQHYGLIAQETENVLVKAHKKSPHKTVPIVDHDAKIDRYGIKYTELISPLIKAVQELYSEVKGLVARVLSVEEKTVLNERSIASVKIEAKAENAELKNKFEAETMALKKENQLLKARLEKIEKFLDKHK